VEPTVAICFVAPVTFHRGWYGEILLSYQGRDPIDR
jgi:hypothetical protein